MSSSGREKQDDRPSEDRELELLKAVAQAWHGHSGNPSPTREFDAASGRRDGHERRPSRFRLEAIRRRQAEAAARWDFGRSLLDSYELVTLSKRLESGLAPEDQNAMDAGGCAPRSRKESRNSLRRLFRVSSSSRNHDDDTLDRPTGDDEEEEDHRPQRGSRRVGMRTQVL